jgi:hypothetical protein
VRFKLDIRKKFDFTLFEEEKKLKYCEDEKISGKEKKSVGIIDMVETILE